MDKNLRTADEASNALFDDARNLRRAWVAATLGLAVVIGVLTLMPTDTLPSSHDHWDKIAHLVAFLALVFPTAVLWPRASAWVGLLAVVYGGGIELVQPYAGRSAELGDLLADMIGVGLGIVLGASLRRVLLARRLVGTG